LLDLVLTEDELIDMGMPRALARRLNQSVRALFERQGWYLALVVAEPAQVNASAAEAAPARVRSGQINPLPKPPVYDAGGLINRKDAVIKMNEVTQWTNGWADTLNISMRVMIEHPELTMTEVLAHRDVLNIPPDRNENKLFASSLVSQWNILSDELVPGSIASGESGLHIIHELFNPSVKVVVSEVVTDLIAFLHPNKSEKLKCSDILKLLKSLRKWRKSLEYFIESGRRPADDMILNSLTLLCKPVASSKLQSMKDSKNYSTWQLMYPELIEYANEIALENREGSKKPSGDDDKSKSKRKKEKEKERERKKRETDPPKPNPDPTINAVIGSGKSSCNEWMMMGKCSNGDKCKFSHDGKPGEIESRFLFNCRNNPCTRTYCPFQHTEGQFKGSGAGGKAVVPCKPKVGGAPCPNPNPQVGVPFPRGLERASPPPHSKRIGEMKEEERQGSRKNEFNNCSKESHYSKDKLNVSKTYVNSTNVRKSGARSSSDQLTTGAAVIESEQTGNDTHERLTVTETVVDSPLDESSNEYYNNDDEVIDMVHSVLKLALDSAATKDVINEDDDDATVSDCKPVRVDTAGGEIVVNKSMSKVHEPGLETEGGLGIKNIRYNLLSLVKKLVDGWSFSAKGDDDGNVSAELADRKGNVFNFEEEDGLLIHKPNSDSVNVMTRSKEGELSLGLGEEINPKKVLRNKRSHDDDDSADDSSDEDEMDIHIDIEPMTTMDPATVTTTTAQSNHTPDPNPNPNPNNDAEVNNVPDDEERNDNESNPTSQSDSDPSHKPNDEDKSKNTKPKLIPKKSKGLKGMIKKYLPSAAMVQGIMALILASGMIMDGGSIPVGKSNVSINDLGSAELLGMHELNNNKKRSIINPNSHIHSAMGHAWHDPDCEVCRRARMTCKRHRRKDSEYKHDNSDKGYVLGIDYIGKYTPDVDGNMYAMTGVEVTSKYGCVVLTKNCKAETSRDALIKMRQGLVSKGKETGRDLFAVHHDDDTSFKGEFKEYVESEKLGQTDTGGYDPKNNSLTERRHRSVKEVFKAMLLESTGGIGYYNALWGPGVVHAFDCVNNIDWHNGHNPSMELTGSKREYNDNSFVFGQSVNYHVAKERRDDVWMTSGQFAVWVGYSNRIKGGHVVVPVEWDSNSHLYKLGGTKHVHHCNHSAPTVPKYPLRMGPVVSDDVIDAMVDKLFMPKYKTVKGDESEQTVKGYDPIMEVDRVMDVRKKGRGKQYLIKWTNSDNCTWEPRANLIKYGCDDLLDEFEETLKPGTFFCYMTKGIINKNVEDVDIVRELFRRQGLNNVEPNSDLENRYIEGYRAEMKQLKERRLKELDASQVSKDVIKNAIPLKMILESKRCGRVKGRGVLRGDLEPLEWDISNIESPVVGMSAVRSFIFMAGKPTDIISSIDISVAFLQSDSYNDGITRYVKYKPHKYSPWRYFLLTGPIYGQRSCARQWYDTVVKWLTEEQGFVRVNDETSKNFIRGENEPCVFTNPATGMKLILYVDDILCRGSSDETKSFYDAIKNRFDTKEPEYVEPSLDRVSPEHKLGFIGFDISCTRDEGSGNLVYCMDQEVYTKELLSNYDIKPIKNIGSPMADMSMIKSNDERLDEVKSDEYRRIMGKLNYLVSTTRYDIGYSVSQCSHFSANPTVGSNRALYRILSYLLATTDFRIQGYNTTYNTVECYSDSDFGGVRPLSTCSHSGTMIMLNGVPVVWSSKRQPKTSISSAQAEIYALSETTKHMLRYKYISDDMILELPDVCRVMTDNTQAVTFSKSMCVSSKLGGVFDMRVGWVKELRDEGKIKVEHIPATCNCADFLTKSLPAYIFRKAMKLVQTGGAFTGYK
jgi:hypothetical protein